MPNCKNCGEQRGIFELNASGICKSCSRRVEEADEQHKAARLSKFSNPAEETILTTAYSIAGREIDSEIEIISAEVVFGMNIFRDVFAGLRDIVGGRSGSVQKVLRDARLKALSELKSEAKLVKADAVIAVSLNYHELTGGGKNGAIMLVASGTAVKLASNQTKS